MSKTEAIKLAEEFLVNLDVAFVHSGVVGRESRGKIEIIFPVLETLDPNVAVVEPPDFRVWVIVESGMVELIDQM